MLFVIQVKFRIKPRTSITVYSRAAFLLVTYLIKEPIKLTAYTIITQMYPNVSYETEGRKYLNPYPKIIIPTGIEKSIESIRYIIKTHAIETRQ
ncbi:hypothetical protein J14TS5_50050 [Paenibacillus lautus]|nr:hypothetical protein J14TS5_50050 [Paenibacillus lautus]